MTTSEPRAEGFFVSGGTLPLDSESYVERECDRALYEALRAGKYCYVLNARQMGKSSLSIRTMARLERDGWTTVSLDLTQMGGRNVTPEQWYIGLAAEVGRAVGLRREIVDYWRENAAFGPMRRFFGTLREVILARIDTPVVVFIDEIDATRNLSFDSDEFFAGIRECFNRRAKDATYNRLTFCLLGVAVPTDLIRNPTTTPFNIGERIYLRDFTREESATLGRALGPNGRTLVDRVHYWTNGHPYLTQSLCAAIAANGGTQTAMDVDRLVRKQMFGPKARDRNVSLADVANRALNAGVGEPDPERFRADLLSAYERALRGKPVPDDESNRVASLLKLSGLVRSDDRRLRVRNRIYEEVFDSEWIRENMPGQELVRLRQAYRRGLVRATLAYGALTATLAALGSFAFQSQRKAEAATNALNRELYVAAMNNLSVFEENGDIGRISATLARVSRSPYRGFEWGLWQSRLHDAKEEYTLDYFAPGKREAGHLSWDGRLICVTDEITLTATVVDRKTRRVVTTRRLPPRPTIVPTRTGFVLIDPDQTPAPVTDLVTGKRVGAVGHANRRIARIGTRPDSPYVLLISWTDPHERGQVAELWHVAAKRRFVGFGGIGTFFDAQADFSRDGRRILYRPFYGPGATAPPKVVVWDTMRKRPIDSFDAPAGSPLYDLSPTGRYVLFAGERGTTRARDVDRRRSVFHREWTSDASPIDACFIDGGHALVTLDQAGRASILEFPSGRPVGERHNVWTISAGASRGEWLASATTVRVFDGRGDGGARVVAKGERIGRDGDGNLVVFEPGLKGLVRMSNPGFEKLSHTPAHPRIKSFTYNGRWQMWDGNDGAAYVSDTRGGEPMRLPFRAANFSGGAASDVIAVVSGDANEIAAISTKTGRPLWRRRNEDLGRGGLWVSPDGKRIFAFVGAASVVVLDSTTGNVLRQLDRHNLRVSNVTFTADRKHFFTCGGDGRAILWDYRTLSSRMQFQGNIARRIVSADLSPDGRRVVTSSESGAWHLWDAETGVQLAEVEVGTGPVRGVMFSRDGKHVVAACPDGKIRVWDSVEGDPSTRIPVSAARLQAIRQ